MSGLREEQIIDAVVAALSASSALQTAVTKHRTYSLSEADAELPMTTVNGGDDNALSDTGTDNLAYIDSLLELITTVIVSGNDESDIRAQLAQKRRAVHQAIMADDTLGLAFVHGVRYAGAAQPQIETAGEWPAGARDIRWQVHYRMSAADPGDT